jgi:hypothetical protein
MCLYIIYLPGEEMETNYDLQQVCAFTGTQEQLTAERVHRHRPIGYRNVL